MRPTPCMHVLGAKYRKVSVLLCRPCMGRSKRETNTQKSLELASAG